MYLQINDKIYNIITYIEFNIKWWCCVRRWKLLLSDGENGYL